MRAYDGMVAETEMKKIDTKGIQYLESIEGTDEWYYAISYSAGDMYEAEELFQAGITVEGTVLLLIHYPDGTVCQPVASKENQCLGRPVYSEGRLCFAGVDFPAGKIRVYGYNTVENQTEILYEMPLSEIKDCYNLMVHGRTLILSCQGHDEFDIYWPERKSYSISINESFFYREDNRLYFSAWYEDPDYREELVVRDIETGEVIERMPGDMFIMPNGEKWHVG